MDKFVAYAEHKTRSEAKKLIHGGCVRVRENNVTDSGYLLSEAEEKEVRIHGRPISANTSLYCMIHKPDGYLTALEDKRLPTIRDLIPDEFIQKGLAPVGRLDYHTTGLLILTNDGTLSHRLTSPKWHIEKVYEISYSGEKISEREIRLFADGMNLREKNDSSLPLLPAKLEPLSSNRARLTLREGKTHQVRRMFAAVNRPVLSLHRSEIGNIRLSDLPQGEMRALTEEEIRGIRGEAGLPEHHSQA